ncbi:MAG: GGDEF domain-containing protein [Pseudomonadota bacterium]
MSLRYKLDTELSNAMMRVAAMLPLIVIIWSDAFIDRYSHVETIELIRPASIAVLFLFLASLALVVVRPKATTYRKSASTILDSVCISGALMLGQEALAPLAVFYIWSMLGVGFVLGVRYLYLATAAATSGFAVVYSFSSYWQSQTALSLTVATSILLLAPYLAGLLSSLHRAKRKISWQANFDALTHVLNRRAFKEYLGDLIDTGDKQQHLLLYCDLDDFKTVNDSAGHAAGDKMLADVAKIFRKNLTPSDQIGRLGGDEFCIALPNRSWEEGRATAENIRNAVASYRLAWGTKYFSVKISIGIASSESVTDGDSWLRLADAACYAAKKAGRNQVHIVDSRFCPADTQRIRNLEA